MEKNEDMKILHVLSEAKFVDLHVAKFKQSGFIDKFVYLNAEFDYNGLNSNLLDYYPTTDSGYSDLISIFDDYNLIILYYLNLDKLLLLSRLQAPYPKIIWSFYGAELYGLPTINSQFLSKWTKRYLYKSSPQAFIRAFKVGLRPIVRTFKGMPSADFLLKSQLHKIYRFNWYNKYEYGFLNSLMQYKLPPFIEASVSHIIPKQENAKKEQIKILIGNSGSYYNNHVDILVLLNNVRFNSPVTIPLSYGATNEYKNYIENISKKGNYEVNILEKMMPYKEYVQLLNEHSVAIFPSYRQMGLGNIFIGIQCNLKIYLSNRNPTFEWLKSKGIKVFSIENELADDLINKNLILDEADQSYNHEAYFNLVNEKNDRRYFEVLDEI